MDQLIFKLPPVYFTFLHWSPVNFTFLHWSPVNFTFLRRSPMKLKSSSELYWRRHNCNKILFIFPPWIYHNQFYLINAQTTQTHEALIWKTIYRKKFKVKITNKSFFKNTKEIWFCTKKSDPAHKIKDLSFCHKLWFSNTFIVATRCRRSLIFQTMISLDHII